MKELAQLTSVIDDMLAVDTTDSSSHDHKAAVQALIREASRLQAAIVLHTSAAQAAADKSDMAEFLTRDCHYSGRDAARLVRTAIRLCTAFPHTLAALSNGDITWAHALTMVRAEGELGVDRVATHEETWIRNVANQSGPERLQRLVRALADEQGDRLPDSVMPAPLPPEQVPDPSAETRAEPVPEQASVQDTASTNDQVEQSPNAPSLAPSSEFSDFSELPPWLGDVPDTVPEWLADEPDDEAVTKTNTTHISGASSANEVSATPEPDGGEAQGPGARCLHPGCTNQPEWCRLPHRIRWSTAETMIGLFVPICQLHREGVDGNDVTVVAVPPSAHVGQTGNPEIAA